MGESPFADYSVCSTDLQAISSDPYGFVGGPCLFLGLAYIKYVFIGTLYVRLFSKLNRNVEL